MPLMAIYRSNDVDRATYARIIKGTASEMPEGAVAHFAGFDGPDGVCVVDVYESRGHFEAFLPKLRRVLGEIGVPWSEPEVYELGAVIATPSLARHAADMAPV